MEQHTAQHDQAEHESPLEAPAESIDSQELLEP